MNCKHSTLHCLKVFEQYRQVTNSIAELRNSQARGHGYRFIADICKLIYFAIMLVVMNYFCILQYSHLSL